MSRPIRTFLSKETMLNVIGIPLRFLNKTLDDFETPTENFKIIKDMVTEYCKDIDNNFKLGKGFYFYGCNGTGKTMLASLILKEAYKHRYSCKMITFYEYIQKVLQVWNAKGDRKDELLEILRTNVESAEFLVIEELGKELESKIDIDAILENILRYRENRCYPTIITTNLDITGISEIYNNSIYSLIRGNNLLVEFNYPDQRVKYRIRS